MYHKIDLKRHSGNPLENTFDLALFKRGSEAGFYIRGWSFDRVQRFIFENPDLVLKSELSENVASLFKWKDPTGVNRYGVHYRILGRLREIAKEENYYD